MRAGTRQKTAGRKNLMKAQVTRIGRRGMRYNKDPNRLNKSRVK